MKLPKDRTVSILYILSSTNCLWVEGFIFMNLGLKKGRIHMARRGKLYNFWVFVVLCGLTLLFAAGAYSEDTGTAGWEKDSAYNALYKASEMDDFKGIVEDIVE